MNIDSAIESFCAWIAKIDPGFPSDVPMFYLGTDEDLESATVILEKDLEKDLLNGIPFPFEGQLLFIAPGSKSTSWVSALVEEDPKNKHAIQLWLFQRFPGREWEHLYSGGGGLILNEVGRFGFGEYEDAQRLEGLTDELTAKTVKSMAYFMALIAHPSNYIVRESPLLTPKEKRRVASGKRFPAAKRARYIIVDHDVLVNRMTSKGTHASPVPHQRRGHWRKLAERCRAARARGAERTWVRNCEIGTTDFIANNRRYQVLTDFHQRYTGLSGGTDPESV